MQKQVLSSSLLTGRIQPNRLADFIIPITKDPFLNLNSVCSLSETIDTRMLQKMVPASPAGGGVANPLEHLLPETSVDWEHNFLSATRLPMDLGSLINTPTLELSQYDLFGIRTESIVAKNDVNVSPSVANHNYEIVWNIPGTPDPDDLLHAVPLAVFEGKCEFINEVPILQAVDDNQNMVDAETSLGETKQEIPDDDLLRWIVDNTINQPSEIPREELKEKVFGSITVMLEQPYSEFLPPSLRKSFVPFRSTNTYTRVETVLAPSTNISTQEEGGGPI